MTTPLRSRVSTGREARPPSVDVALRALLAEHPDAFVAAIDPGPNGLFIPPQPDTPLHGRRTIEATTFLDVVVPSDRIVVIETWERARAAGAARGPVHPLWSPDTTAQLHFFDVTPEYGIYAGVLTGADGDAETRDAPQVAPIPPRVARVRKNELAILLDVDPATTEILGWPAQDMIGRRSLEFLHPDDHQRAIQSWMQMLANPGLRHPVRLRHQRSDGSWLWMELANHNLLDDPAAGCVVTEMVDISDEMAAHEALRAREQLLHRLAEALPIGVFQVAADRRILYTNDRLRMVLGVEPKATLEAQLGGIAAEDRPALEIALNAALNDGIDQDVEVRVRLEQPVRTRQCMVRVRALSDAAGAATGAIVCVEDVTESAQLRAELEQQASHDTLTRVMNRRSIMAYLDAALAGSSRRGTAVIFVDLDDFKSINDRFGHAAGDELLRVAADRLAITVRSNDAIGRIGGDEFLVVCPEMASAAQAGRVARRIGLALSRRVRLSGATIDMRASVGVAYASRESVSADALVRRADAAMYESKRAGRTRPASTVTPGQVV